MKMSDEKVILSDASKLDFLNYFNELSLIYEEKEKPIMTYVLEIQSNYQDLSKKPNDLSNESLQLVLFFNTHLINAFLPNQYGWVRWKKFPHENIFKNAINFIVDVDGSVLQTQIEKLNMLTDLLPIIKFDPPYNIPSQQMLELNKNSEKVN